MYQVAPSVPFVPLVPFVPFVPGGPGGPTPEPLLSLGRTVDCAMVVAVLLSTAPRTILFAETGGGGGALARFLFGSLGK